MPESALSHRWTGTANPEYSPTATNFVPTLYIGLGGTGRNVLLRFRKALFDEHKSVRPKCCRFLVIDTDEQQKDSLDVGAKAEDAFLPARLDSGRGEFIGCNISEAKYNATLSSFEDKNDRRYKNWLQPNFRKLVPPAAVTQGAGTYRQAGRLAFFMHYEAIRSQLKRHLEEMFDEATAPNLEVFPKVPGEVDSKSLEVVIVTSLAGGTGSGCFIDAAYLIQDLIGQQAVEALKNVSAHVTMIAFLPTIYAKKQPALAARFRQNAYASLLEMEHYSTFRPDDTFGGTNGDGAIKGVGSEFRVNWSSPTGSEQVIRRRPWDTCYLIDDINDRQPGKIRPADELYQMVADYLFLDFGNSPFAISKRSARSNHRQLIDRLVQSTVLASFDDESKRKHAELFANRYGSTFSSFGLAEIVIDSERINRAASYRLAVKLIAERWIGGVNQFTDSQYQAWAKSDLKDGDPPVGESERIPFGPDQIWPQLLKSGNNDWLAQLAADFKRMNGRHSPELLSKYLADFAGTLARQGGAGVDASPRQTMGSRCRELTGAGAELGKLQHRLERLTRARFQQMGTAPILKLLSVYQDAMHKCTDLTGKWRRELAGLPSDEALTARLTNAQEVKFPCHGVAVSRTYAWTLEDSERVLRDRYRLASLDPLDRVYGELRGFVGSGQQNQDGVHATLFGHYKNVQDFLHNIETMLQADYKQFAQFAGGDLKISLLPDWADKDYDREIDLALRKHKDIGTDPNKEAFDWPRAEQQIIQHLLQKSPEVPSHIQTFPALIDYWLEQVGLNHDFLKAIVEVVAQACRNTLGEDGINLANFANGNVINYLSSQPETARRSKAKQLVDAAAPYLPATNVARIENFRLCCRNILGRSGDNIAPANLNQIEQIINDVAVQGAADHQLEEIHEKKDIRRITRLALVRELAGFPLCLYSRLPELEEAYFDRQLDEQRKTCHIKYRETFEDLPDILLVEDDAYRAIREYVDYVFRGLVLRFIEREPNGMFCVRIHNPLVGEQVVPLGLRINRIVKHACDNSEVREYLKKCWQRWSTEKASPTHFAVVYSALQQSRDLIKRQRREVEPLPALNCLYRLLESTASDLRKTDEGQQWYELLRDRDSFDSDFEEWRDVRYPRACERIRQACLTLSEKGSEEKEADAVVLPVYQIDLKKIDQIRFAEVNA